MTPPYPFAAVVGLADLRMALLLNAVSPAIGGVLVRGEKGTAKSTMVRALAALLPEGLIFKQGNFGMSTAFRLTDDISWDHTGQYTAVAPFAYTGP